MRKVSLKTKKLFKIYKKTKVVPNREWHFAAQEWDESEALFKKISAHELRLKKVSEYYLDEVNCYRGKATPPA